MNSKKKVKASFGLGYLTNAIVETPHLPFFIYLILL